MRRLETAAIVGSALSALLTLVLLDFEAIELSRQVKYVAPSGADKVLIFSYQHTIRMLVILPLALLASLAIPIQIQATRIRRSALVLSALPLAIALMGLAAEKASRPPAYSDMRSTTDSDLNVVLIVIDTLRADHLGAYGYAEETSPFLDFVAARGVRFARCHTPASWTKPSVASLMTSLYPGQHGAVHFRQQLPMAVDTIAEIMSDAGFVTYGHVANPNLKTIFNFDQGFGIYDDHLMRDRLSQATLRSMPWASAVMGRLTGLKFTFRDNDDIATALPRITSWLDRHHEQDFFMYLHFMEPHKPYAPPPPYDTMFPGRGANRSKQETRLYDGEIRYLDEHLKKLFGEFERLGILDKTLFIITSDHGEAFGEHGDWEHDHTVYQEQLHVPLIMRYGREDWSGLVVKGAVRTLDIAPTILDYAGIEVPKVMAGQSLRPNLRPRAVQDDNAEIFVDHSSARSDYRLKAVIVDGRYKFIRTLKSRSRNTAREGDEELYDLHSDPGELHNLIMKRPEVANALRKRMQEYEHHSKSATPLPPPIELDAGTSQQLKALGYME